MAEVISISSLTKRFGEIVAVDDLSFSVREGELFAFLGVNGAGKSTTINIICGQLERDFGSVTVNGVDIDSDMRSVRSSLGVVFQGSVLDRALTVRDNLQSRAAMYGITGEAFERRMAELDKMLELKELLRRPVGKLSGGQRRRVDIARALIHRPRILILDEPTTGLDPQTRRMMWDVIEGLRRTDGLTVFLTTHYMEEAADADYVVILDRGRIAAQGSPLELKNRYTGDFITLYGVSREQAMTLSADPAEVPGGYRISVKSTEEATALIMRHPELFVDYEIVKGKMDDVFLAVTGISGAEAEEK